MHVDSNKLTLKPVPYGMVIYVNNIKKKKKVLQASTDAVPAERLLKWLD